jgi:U3 small nucleolar RNA-associated protein 21
VSVLVDVACSALARSAVSRSPLPFSPPSPRSHLVTHKEHTFTASAAGISVWDRSRCVRTLRWASAPVTALDGEAEGDVLALLIAGDVLFSLHADDVIRAWNWKAALASGEEEALLSLVHLPQGSQATCFDHPPTYLNKLAVGTRAGSVLIVNVRTGAVVHNCVLCPGVAITCLAPSSVPDVLAAGAADGRVLVHNLRLDEGIAAFSHALEEGGGAGGSASVTALAFSTDAGTLGDPTLASGTEGGALALWNLRTQVLGHALPAAHDGAVRFLSFLPRQPLLLSAGADNAVRVLALDKLTGPPKPLRARSGHQAPPRIIRYYSGASVGSLGTGADAAVCEIISAGCDRALRLFHTALPRQDIELSQGKGLVARARELGVQPSSLRLPPVTALAVCDRRRGQWADVVTVHAGEGRAFAWSWENKSIEDRALVLPNAGRESAVSVTISSCGHFAVVGGMAGTVAKFNLQSGARRGVFPADESVSSSYGAKGQKRAKGGLHAESFGPVDRDVGKGRGPGNGLKQVDSIDNTLFAGMGVLPPSIRAAAARAEAAAAVAKGGAPAPFRGHTSPVYGVGSDALNRYVVSADASGRVCWWDFTSHAYVGELLLPAGAAGMTVSRDAGLAAVPCDDFAVRVLDLATRRLVRTFVGHSNRVTDVSFSYDSRWLGTASLDSSIRVWDLPTARCIDWVSFASPPVSLAWSPTGAFLATAHADGPAICLWASRTHFGATLPEAAPTVPFRLDSPPAASAESEGATETDGIPSAPAPAKKQARREEEEEAEADGMEGGKAGGTQAPLGTDAGAPEPRPGCRVTLSGLPEAAWVDLPRMDAIAARNKPTQAPSKPTSAPFFLPTTGGLAPTFAAASASALVASVVAAGGMEEDEEGTWEGAEAGAPRSRFVDAGATVAGGGGARRSHGGAGALAASRSAIVGLLSALSGAEGSGAARDALRGYMRGCTPAALDVAVRSIALGGPTVDPAGCASLATLLGYLASELTSGRGGFDLSNAQTALVLAVYQTSIAEAVAAADGTGEERALCASLREGVRALRRAQAPDAVRLREAVDKALCLVAVALGH